jgi:hypothetical protein
VHDSSKTLQGRPLVSRVTALTVELEWHTYLPIVSLVYAVDIGCLKGRQQCLINVLCAQLVKGNRQAALWWELYLRAAVAVIAAVG